MNIDRAYYCKSISDLQSVNWNYKFENGYY
jgi:hypothetical protein